ncbi:MAG: hypothetical protein ABSD44_15455 [Terracidiphilus sp.]
MSQPVKLSDALVLDARIAGAAQERSIAGQVEFWAKLGQSMELLLDGRQVLALQRNASAQPLAEALASVDTPEGRKRVADVLARQPYPHYKQYSPQPGLLLRIDENGAQTVGRFVNRVFTAVEASSGLPSQQAAPAELRSTRKNPRTKSASIRSEGKLEPQRKERAAWA